MKIAQGFTLIECIIYLSVSSLLTLIFLQAFIILQKEVWVHVHTAHEHITLATCIESMRYDIASAPGDIQRWSSTGPSLIRWSDDSGNQIAFGFKNNNMLKITRARTSDSNIKGPAYCVLAQNITGTFSVKTNAQCVHSVEVQATALNGDKQDVIHVTMRTMASHV